MSLLLSGLFFSMAHAHGIWGHIHVTGWAIENLEHPELVSLFSNPEVKNAALFGAAFTDSGYFPFLETTSQYSHIYSEYTHWEPFVQDYIIWMQLHDPPPFDSLESQKRVAFLMGAASHGLQDEIFDSLFLQRAGEEDGSDQGNLDPACDGFLAQDGELRFFPAEDIPFAPLLDIYAALDEEIDAEIIQDSVALMVGLYVNEESGRDTAEQLATLYGEGLDWSRSNYLNPEIPGSLQSEIYPSMYYMNSIWKRLHQEFDPKDLLISTFPEKTRTLNSIEAESIGSWSTAIFGQGVQAGSIEIQMQSIVGSPVPISFNGTQWGADWTRLVRIYPQQDLHYDQQYLVSLHNLHTINGETTETTGFIVHAPCQTPMSISCLELGVPKEASRKDSPIAEPEVKQSCTHIPSMTYWSWILILTGFFCLRAKKT